MGIIVPTLWSCGKALNTVAPAELLEQWLPREEALSRYYCSHTWQPQISCKKKAAELGGRRGVGSQFLGSVPSVAAALRAHLWPR